MSDTVPQYVVRLSMGSLINVEIVDNGPTGSTLATVAEETKKLLDHAIDKGIESGLIRPADFEEDANPML